MGKKSESDSETDENSENSSSNDEENESNHGEQEVEVISEYEKQRLERIKENRARLEALRLPSLASSLLGSVQKKGKSKEKKKKGKDEDEEYNPSDGDERASYSSNEEGEEEDDEVEDESPEASNRKGKSRQSLHKSNSKTKRSVQKRRRELEYVDDDEALQKAIALSLAESEVSGAVLRESLHNSRTDVTDVGLEERKQRPIVPEIDKRKKKRQSNTSRVQLTEDQATIHFFQFDARNTCGQWETKFKCKHCGKTMKDGCRNGLMQHLDGCFSEIAACEDVPLHVKEEMKKHLFKRASSVFPKRVRKRQPRVVLPQEEEVEDPELRLQQDIEEAIRRSMKDSEYKEMEGIKIAMLESQRLNTRCLGSTSLSRTLQPKMTIEISDDEPDQIFRLEAGKGGITVNDLRRVAIDHDFIWSDKEINDMVHLFDSDGDGKLHLDDFRKILHRCNMIKG